MQNPWYLAFFVVWRACFFFVSSRRGHLEFSLQMGSGGDRQGANKPREGLACWWELAFSVVGILIIISFRFDWHPFSGLPTKQM